jgi:cation diffusion facilitator family transporter
MSDKSPSQNRSLHYKGCEKCANSIGPVNVVANVFLMILKGYLGIVGKSAALTADAIHSAADVIASLMLLIGLKISERPANRKYPWGYGKVEFLVAVAIYTSLICAGVVIFFDGIACILDGTTAPPSTITLIGAFISIAVNEMMYRQSICAGRQINSPAIMANAWEKRSDAVSSVAVFVGIAGAKMGWYFLDPAAALLVAFYIVKFSVEMLIEAFKGLLDTALSPEVVDSIRETAQAIEGVRGIEAIRTREVGQSVWIDLEVLVAGSSNIVESDQLKDKIRHAVQNGLGQEGQIVVYLKPV